MEIFTYIGVVFVLLLAYFVIKIFRDDKNENNKVQETSEISTESGTSHEPKNAATIEDSKKSDKSKL